MSEEIEMGLTGEDIKKRNELSGIIGLFQTMGDNTADPRAIAESEDGRLIEECMSVMSMGEDSSDSRAYWANYEKGLRKEVHGEGLQKWANYVPLAAEKEPERKFPLIFCLHSAHKPIQLTESYGIM